MRDAEWDVVDVDTVDAPRLQKEPFVGCRCRLAENVQAEVLQGGDSRQAGNIEEVEIGLDNPRLQGSHGGHDVVERRVPGEPEQLPVYPNLAELLAAS